MTRANSAMLACEQEHLGCTVMTRVVPTGERCRAVSTGQLAGTFPAGPGAASYPQSMRSPTVSATTQTIVALHNKIGRRLRANRAPFVNLVYCSVRSTVNIHFP